MNALYMPIPATRQKRPCPICGTHIFHVRDEQAYSKEDSLAYHESFGSREITVHLCPLPNCGACVGRVDKHLLRKHRLDVDATRLYCRMAKLQVFSIVVRFMSFISDNTKFISRIITILVLQTKWHAQFLSFFSNSSYQNLELDLNIELMFRMAAASLITWFNTKFVGIITISMCFRERHANI